MIDPELKSYLAGIHQNLEKIQYNTGSRWRSFFNGMLSAFGYVIGAAIAIALIGWVLNAVGVIPALKNQTQQWQKIFQQAQQSPASPIQK